jgi:hypothetical protein
MVVDCLSPYAFDMVQVRGEALPRRACPLRPKGTVAGPLGPPVDWLTSWYELPPEGKERIGKRWSRTKEQPQPPSEARVKYGRLKASVFDSGNPDEPLKPSDRFAVISVASCNDCKYASAGTVAIKKEQRAILEAFHKQLAVEDFSAFPDLADDDLDGEKDPWESVRNHRAWKINWEEISIVG